MKVSELCKYNCDFVAYFHIKGNAKNQLEVSEKK